jgi:hypothetical protein
VHHQSRVNGTTVHSTWRKPPHRRTRTNKQTNKQASKQTSHRPAAAKGCAELPRWAAVGRCEARVRELEAEVAAAGSDHAQALAVSGNGDLRNQLVRWS